MAKRGPQEPEAPARKATGKPRPRKPATAKKTVKKTTSSASVREGEKTTAGVGKAAIHGVKAFSDTVILPGSSLMMDGDVKGGLLHAAGGLLARSIWGPVGWLLVGANSFSNSVSGKHLHQHFFSESE